MWEVRRCSCVLGVSVYRAYRKIPGDRGVCGLECCLAPKLQRMTSQCGGIGLVSCQTYRSVRYQVLCRSYRSVRYRHRCCTDTGTGFGTYVHTGTAGTGIDVVPNLPECPVPVLSSYRTYCDHSPCAELGFSTPHSMIYRITMMTSKKKINTAPRLSRLHSSDGHVSQRRCQPTPTQIYVQRFTASLPTEANYNMHILRGCGRGVSEGDLLSKC